MSAFSNIFILLVLYQFKHFFADYPLQGAYMLKKFMGGWQWVLPLAAHAGVHGAFTLGITLIVAPTMWWLCFVDFVCHFVMDRIKASPNLLGRFKALSGNEFVALLGKRSYLLKTGLYIYNETEDEIGDIDKQFSNNTYFWWSLGLDQMVHHLTHYYIIWMLVTA